MREVSVRVSGAVNVRTPAEPGRFAGRFARRAGEPGRWDRWHIVARRVGARFGLIGLMLAALAGCAETQLASHMVGVMSPKSQGGYKIGQPYQIRGVWYYPAEDFAYDQSGIASWYGPGFHKKRTANGEIFDQNALTAAHPTLQMPALVRVTNLENGRALVLRINDRGPFANGRLIDISRRGAELLGFREQGTARVRVQVLSDESRQLAALARQGRGGDTMMAAAPASGVTTVAVEAPARPFVAPAPTVRAQPTPALPAPVMAKPVIVQTPVEPTGIFIQAGAFSVYDNADRLRSQLAPIANAAVSPTTVDGAAFYRVRLGPFASVEDADQALDAVIGNGQTDARIIVD